MASHPITCGPCRRYLRLLLDVAAVSSPFTRDAVLDRIERLLALHADPETPMPQADAERIARRICDRHMRAAVPSA